MWHCSLSLFHHRWLNAVWFFFQCCRLLYCKLKRWNWRHVSLVNTRRKCRWMVSVRSLAFTKCLSGLGIVKLQLWGGLDNFIECLTAIRNKLEHKNSLLSDLKEEREENRQNIQKIGMLLSSVCFPVIILYNTFIASIIHVMWQIRGAWYPSHSQINSLQHWRKKYWIWMLNCQRSNKYLLKLMVLESVLING